MAEQITQIDYEDDLAAVLQKAESERQRLNEIIRQEELYWKSITRGWIIPVHVSITVDCVDKDGNHPQQLRLSIDVDGANSSGLTVDSPFENWKHGKISLLDVKTLEFKVRLIESFGELREAARDKALAYIRTARKLLTGGGGSKEAMLVAKSKIVETFVSTHTPETD